MAKHGKIEMLTCLPHCRLKITATGSVWSLMLGAKRMCHPVILYSSLFFFWQILLQRSFLLKWTLGFCCSVKPAQRCQVWFSEKCPCMCEWVARIQLGEKNILMKYFFPLSAYFWSLCRMIFWQNTEFVILFFSKCQYICRIWLQNKWVLDLITENITDYLQNQYD